jgi:hypothetical protein
VRGVEKPQARARLLNVIFLKSDGLQGSKHSRLTRDTRYDVAKVGKMEQESPMSVTKALDSACMILF